MQDERFEDYYKLPKIILEIMDWLCDTKFYQKTFKERKEYYNDIEEKWKFCDFKIIEGTLEKPLIIKIGEISSYKYDHEKTLCINFNSIDNCYIFRGYATGLYASQVIGNEYHIPKYMKSDLKTFIERYRQEVL